MIFLILLFSLVLRVININQSLWLDEAINVLAAQQNAFWGMVTEYAKFDFHPPGFFALLWVWTKIFGYSEIMVRLPSLIFGVLTVWIIYLLGKKLVSAKLGLVAALLLALNPLHIYYSQEARMYSLAALAVALNFLFFIKILKEEKFAKFGYFLTAWLVLLSDYLTYFVFPAQLIFILSTKYKKLGKEWLISLLAAVLLFWAFWLPVFVEQIKIGLGTASSISGWREVVGSFGIKPLALTLVKFIIGRVSFSDKLIYFLSFLPIGLLYAFLIAKGFIASKNDLRKLLLGWLLISGGLAWGVSSLVPVYSYFRVLFLLIPFLLLVAIGIYSLKGKLFYSFLTPVILLQLLSVLAYLVNPTFQREDWRGTVEFLKNKPLDYQILFESTGSFTPFDYYSQGKIVSLGGLKVIPALTDQDLVDLKTSLINKDTVYLLDYLVDITDPNRLLLKKLLEIGYKEQQIYNFHGVGFVRQFTKMEI